MIVRLKRWCWQNSLRALAVPWRDDHPPILRSILLISSLPCIAHPVPVAVPQSPLQPLSSLLLLSIIPSHLASFGLSQTYVCSAPVLLAHVNKRLVSPAALPEIARGSLGGGGVSSLTYFTPHQGIEPLPSLPPSITARTRSAISWSIGIMCRSVHSVQLHHLCLCDTAVGWSFLDPGCR